MTKLEANKNIEAVKEHFSDGYIENDIFIWNVSKEDGLLHLPFPDMTSDLYNCGFIYKTVKEKTDKAREDDDEKFWDNYLKTEFQADDKIQASAGKSTNNNPELKTKGENDE